MVDAVTRQAHFQDYNLNAQGRKGNTGYYVSLGYLSSEGLVIGSDMERFSGRINLESKQGFFSMGATMSYSYSTQNGYSQSTSGSMSSPMVAAISSMSPLYPFYNEDGSYANVDGYNPIGSL